MHSYTLYNMEGFALCLDVTKLLHRFNLSNVINSHALLDRPECSYNTLSFNEQRL